MRALAADAKLDIDAALDSLDQRIGFLAARGMKVADYTFSAAFVRDLDYYTGFVFEAVDPARADGRPAVGGGRYDGLASASAQPRIFRPSARRSGSIASLSAGGQS